MPSRLARSCGCCPPDRASQEGGAEESDGVSRGLESESEFELRCEWHGVAIIDRVEVGDETQDALLLLHLFLLPGDLLSRENCVHRGYRLCNPEPDARQVHMLTWLKDDFRRTPFCESAGADRDTV